MEIAYNSTNPYNFTFALRNSEEKYSDSFLTAPYDPYKYRAYVLFRLIFGYLKNVRLQYASQEEVFQRLSNVTGEKGKRPNQFFLSFEAMEYGVIDTAQLFFSIWENEPEMVHVSPISHRNSDIIISSVRSDAQRESTETLSFQGLPSSVWVLVGFSLLVVSGLATYFSLKIEKKNRRERALNSLMNNLWIYAADIVNNCVARVIRSGPGRNLRSWWLLGVAFLIEFWVAGMTSDLLIDKSSFIDSLEDLFSRPELILVMTKSLKDHYIFGVSADDPRFKDYEKKKIRYVENKYDKEWVTLLATGSGVILGQDISALTYFNFRVKKLKEAKRKQYNGKKRYKERSTHMLFNKWLPRAIKEDIDYLTSRLFETRQAEPNTRREKFRSRKFIFDPTDDSASSISWSAQNVTFLSPVFRLWIIGMSLATVAFCVEFYMLRRKLVKVSPHQSLGIRIRAK